MFTGENNDTNQPFFSVIIPVYNAEKLIGECIQSLRSQDFKNWEAIIVDDCSKDNSLNVIQNLTAHDSRFRLLKHQKNKGAAAARNLAIQEAKGIWCCFLDSDNEMLNGYLNEVYDNVSALPEQFGIFWTGCKRILHHKNGTIEEIDSIFSLPENEKLSKVDFLKKLRVGTGTGLSLKRKYLLEAGLFDETLKAAEDTDLMYRLVWKCDFACSNKVLFNYHVYYDKVDRLTTNYESQFVAYEVICKKNAALLKNEKWLRHRAYSKLIRYAIFSHQPKERYAAYVQQFKKDFGIKNKLMALYYLSSITGGSEILINFYKKMSAIRK